MKKKIIAILTIVLISTSLLFAQGGAESNEKTTEGKKVVTIWSWSPLTRTMDKMIKAFEEEHPDITIDFSYYNYDPEYLSALSAGAASGTLPDIIATQPGALTQQYSDYLIDLSDYSKKEWTVNWEDNFAKVLLDQVYLGNPSDNKKKVNFLPIEGQVISIEYNKELFKKLGLSVPTNRVELQNVCDTLVSNGYAPLFQGAANDWHNLNMYLMLVSQYGGQHFDQAQQGTIKWTNKVFVEAMQTWKEMFDDGIFQIGALSASCYSDGTTAFTSGQAGMIALGSWWTQEFTGSDVAKTVANWDFDYFFLPAMKDNLTASLPIGGIDFGMGITTNSKDTDAAWTVLSSLVSGAGIQACADDLNNLPAFKGIKPNAENLPSDIVDQFNSNSKALVDAMNQRVASSLVDTALKNALQAVATGELTPYQAMESVQKAQDRL